MKELGNDNSNEIPTQSKSEPRSFFGQFLHQAVNSREFRAFLIIAGTATPLSFLIQNTQAAESTPSNNRATPTRMIPNESRNSTSTPNLNIPNILEPRGTPTTINL